MPYGCSQDLLSIIENSDLCRSGSGVDYEDSFHRYTLSAYKACAHCKAVILFFCAGAAAGEYDGYLAAHDEACHAAACGVGQALAEDITDNDFGNQQNIKVSAAGASGVALDLALIGLQIDWERYCAFVELGGLYSLKDTNTIFMFNSRIVSLGVGVKF